MHSRKLLVFGGTGYVGSAIVRKALQRGWRVVSATRGGVPTPGSPLHDISAVTHQNHEDALGQGSGDRATQSPRPLEFVSLDAGSRSQVFEFMEDHLDATAVISCVGVLTRDHIEARRVCGDANVNIAAALYEKASAVRRMVLISAEPPGRYASIFLKSRWALKGYFLGKEIAERAVLENLGDRGAVLRPGFIHGTRYQALGVGCVPVPLWLIGSPLEMAFRPLHCGGLLAPPISVEVVAEAALRAAESLGPCLQLDYYGMQQICGESNNVCGEPKEEKAAREPKKSDHYKNGSGDQGHK
uniref:NAD-dependent epimerase/dehydratase domain-containing protein n=1 Tax=Trypanosoma congolense (strain IL3000) TaxID=1068625 RepID=G0UQ91_TRYCI|nr:conserved hypothetical protein [Trypanosoma congolense IL3000]